MLSCFTAACMVHQKQLSEPLCVLKAFWNGMLLERQDMPLFSSPHIGEVL